MATSTLVPVDEYLRTSYRPDREYVDGVVLERNVAELDHSDLQTELAHYFRTHRKRLRVHAFVEQRVQVAPRRFRVPDLCLVAGPKPTSQVLTVPPLVVIEILSKDDSVDAMQARIDDFLGFGVRAVWVINPRTRRAWVYTMEGSREAKDGLLRIENPEVVLSLTEIFSSLD